MEITVCGRGVSSYAPNMVQLHLTFYARDDQYDGALRLGVESAKNFAEQILPKHEFSVDDMKTKSFSVAKQQHYNHETRTYVDDGYAYTQHAYLEFNYDRSKLTNIIEDIAELVIPPRYTIDFTVDNVKECRSECLAKAYGDAREQAEAIAAAAGLQLRNCVKTDFRPFTSSFVSSGYDDRAIRGRAAIGAAKASNNTASIAEMINQTFTPEDVEISETLYCLWIAE